MRGLAHLTWIEFKLFLREPVAVFFTLLFPLLLLFVFGAIYGNSPGELVSGWGVVDLMVQGFIGVVIGIIVFIGLPISLATYREQGILKRLRATPVSAAAIIAAHVLVSAFMFATSIGVLLLVGRIAHDLRMPVSPVGLAAASALSYVAFAAFAFVIAGVVPTARTAQAIGSAIFFPQMFLSGSTIPRELFPGPLKTMSEYLPMTQVTILIQEMWQEGVWNGTAVIALCGIGIVGAILSVWLFRWE